mmetsp:Transcript_25963/g.54703  ORF Transcript_25963/g.54703 Transcript_25963/m.54703 type:complete len:156 (+) Transcript_25963:303-770(+)
MKSSLMSNLHTFGNDLYPKTVTEAYSYLTNYEGSQGVRFQGNLEGITLTNQEGTLDARYLIPGKEHITCNECGFRGHFKGNSICPNHQGEKKKNAHKQVANATVDEDAGDMGDSDHNGDLEDERVHCALCIMLSTFRPSGVFSITGNNSRLMISQ